METTYNHQAELIEGLINIHNIAARRADMAALRAKYAYADTKEYTERCETAQQESI